MATAAAVGLASTAIVAAGGGSAAAAPLPNAQAVGRLADGAVGGNPIQSIADVQDARATAPGTTSSQNPLTATLLNQLKLPLDNLIQIPTNPAVDAGVVNQVASANLDGKSLGAAGAVADDGGASIGDDNDGAPAFGTIDLTGDALGGSVAIPGLPTTIPGLPGGGGSTVDALGGITASVGAVYAKVGTAKGGDVVTPSSGIAGLDLTIASPALAALITQLKGVFGTTLGTLLTGLPVGAVLPSGCALTDPTVDPIDLAGKNGGVTIDVTNAKIQISLAKLLKAALGVDISNLDTSNFDLISFLVKQLPSILSQGVGGIVDSLLTSLSTQFTNCLGLFGPLGALLGQVTTVLNTGQAQLVTTLNGLAANFESTANSPLGQLADGLENIVDIGLNVQSGPGIEPRDTDYPFESNLEATPNQSTDVVKNQTLVRAIEIQVLNASGIPGGLPDLGLPVSPRSAKVRQLAGNAVAARPLAKAPGDGAINLALANAAAGPSNAPTDETSAPPSSSSVPPTVVPTTNIPTGIPAGQAAGSHDDGLPVLPLVAILMLLTVSGGAFWQYRMRGLHQG